MRERDAGDVRAGGVCGAHEVRRVHEARATVPTLEAAVGAAGHDEAAGRAAASGTPEYRSGRELAALTRAGLHALLELLVVAHVPDANRTASEQKQQKSTQVDAISYNESV